MAGHEEGIRLLLGFAFENGKRFWLASDESALPSALDFMVQPQYALFVARARNAKKKSIGWSIELKIPSWNQVKFDYKEWPIAPSKSEA